MNCLKCRVVGLKTMWAFQNQRDPAECAHLGQNLTIGLGQVLLLSFNFLLPIKFRQTLAYNLFGQIYILKTSYKM